MIIFLFKLLKPKLMQPKEYFKENCLQIKMQKQRIIYWHEEHLSSEERISSNFCLFTMHKSWNKNAKWRWPSKAPESNL